MVSLAARVGLAHRLVDAEPLDAGHGGDRGALIVAFHDEQRPDQVVGGELVFAHHAARPFAAPVAAQAGGQVKAFAIRRRLMLDGRQAGAGFDGAAEFDCHGGPPGSFLTGLARRCHPGYKLI